MVGSAIWLIVREATSRGPSALADILVRSSEMYHSAKFHQKLRNIGEILRFYDVIRWRPSAISLPRDSYAKRGICRRRVSVCVSVCHSGIVSKRLNIGSRKQRRTIAP